MYCCSRNATQAERKTNMQSGVGPQERDASGKMDLRIKT